MTDLLKPEDFSSLSGPLTVSVKIGEVISVIDLTVVSVNERPAHRFRDAPFTVAISAPRDPLLPQGTYPVRHPTLGVIHLFMVPVGRDAQSAQYEVTFN